MDEYTIDDLFLPLEATKDKLVMVVFHDQLTVAELDQMARCIISSLRNAGFYDNAVAFGYTSTTCTMDIFVKIPVFDIYNHLHSC